MSILKEDLYPGIKLVRNQSVLYYTVLEVSETDFTVRCSNNIGCRHKYTYAELVLFSEYRIEHPQKAKCPCCIVKLEEVLS